MTSSHLEGFVPFPPDRAAHYRAAGYWTGQTVDSILSNAAQTWSTHVAVVDADGPQRLTFAQLDERADRAAAGLAELGIAAPLPQLGQGYGLGLGVRKEAGLAPVPGSPGDFYWGGALGPYFWVDPVEKMSVVFMLQELNVQIRTRYRSLLRALVYQALR